jgi:TRAP-type mannitol/chloroaromatic compound transport system permease small subunit
MRENIGHRLIDPINRINEAVAGTMSWLCVDLALVTVSDETLRYGLARGSMTTQSLEWHLFSLIFLLGAGYTLAIVVIVATGACPPGMTLRTMR